MSKKIDLEEAKRRLGAGVVVVGPDGRVVFDPDPVVLATGTADARMEKTPAIVDAEDYSVLGSRQLAGSVFVFGTQQGLRAQQLLALKECPFVTLKYAKPPRKDAPLGFLDVTLNGVALVYPGESWVASRAMSPAEFRGQYDSAILEELRKRQGR